MLLIVWMSFAKAEPMPIEISSGLRMGYSYVEGSKFRNPHVMLLGYEQSHILNTGTALDFLVTGNVSLVGMNQGVVKATGHLLFGYQMRDLFHIGIGPFVTIEQLNPDVDGKLNMIMAGGWTVPMEGFSIPVQISYVPDLDGEWRGMATTGISWYY